MRILHTSIPVRDPKRVAQALAELVEGATFDFLHPGCYFVTFGEPGSLIELYRKEIELHPGEPGKPCDLLDSDSPASFTGSHTAIRVSASTDRVLEIARVYGWLHRFIRLEARPLPCRACGRAKWPHARYSKTHAKRQPLQFLQLAPSTDPAAL